MYVCMYVCMCVYIYIYIHKGLSGFSQNNFREYSRIMQTKTSEIKAGYFGRSNDFGKFWFDPPPK